MPIKKYDKYVGNAEALMSKLKQQYGPDKGKMVFYAMVNKKKKRG